MVSPMYVLAFVFLFTSTVLFVIWQCRGKILACLCPVDDIEIGVEFVLPIEFFSVTGSTAAPQQIISDLPVFRFQKRRENEVKPAAAPQQGSSAGSSSSAMGNSTLSRSSSTNDTATHDLIESAAVGNSQRTAPISRQEQSGLQARHSSSNDDQLSSAQDPDQQQHLDGLQDCTSGQALDSSSDSCRVPQHSSMRCSCTNNSTGPCCCLSTVTPTGRKAVQERALVQHTPCQHKLLAGHGLQKQQEELQESAHDNDDQSVKPVLSKQDGQLLLQENEQQHLPRMLPQQQQQQQQQEQEQREENEAGTSASCSTGGESSSSASGASGGSGSVQDGSMSCVICFADYDEGEMIKQLPCQHCYHAACIDIWLRRCATCPLCKQLVWQPQHPNFVPC